MTEWMSEPLVPHTMQPPPNAHQVLDRFFAEREEPLKRIHRTAFLVLNRSIGIEVGKLLANAKRKYDHYWRDTRCAVCGVGFDKVDREHHHAGMFNRTCKEHQEFAQCYDLRYELERRNMPPPFVNPNFWTP